MGRSRFRSDPASGLSAKVPVYTTACSDRTAGSRRHHVQSLRAIRLLPATTRPMDHLFSRMDHSRWHRSIPRSNPDAHPLARKDSLKEKTRSSEIRSIQRVSSSLFVGIGRPNGEDATIGESNSFYKPKIAAIFCQDSVDRDCVPSLYTPAIGTAQPGFAQAAGTCHLKGPMPHFAVLVGCVQRQIAMWIHPLHFRDCASDIERLVHVKLCL